MHETLEKLLNGDAQIVHYYETAKREWDQFFVAHQSESVAEWAQWLTDKQIVFFEHQCGGRSLGQEVMAWSGYGALYDIGVGFEDNLPQAKKLAAAFEQSMCSLEVKGQAARAAASFGLDED